MDLFASPIQFLDESRWNQTTAPLVCYAPTMISMYGIWHGEHLVDYTLPLFILQLLLVILATRLSIYLLRLLHQPRYIYEIIGGVMLGPSVLGRIPLFSIYVFPLRSVLILEAIANLGLIFFIFTVGVELEIDVIPRMGRKAAVFASAAFVGPVLIGVLSGLGLFDASGPGAHRGASVIFIGVALSVTSFSVLARILAELKLLNSDVGRLAVSSALLNDTVAWILLSVAVTLAHNNDGGDGLSSIWTVVSGAVFLGLCFLCVRPAVLWVMRRTPEGEEVDELYACGILVGVLASAFVADMIGTHAIFGAFVYGLAVPNGTVGEAVIDKIEDFVTGLLMPLFFTITGLRTDLRTIKYEAAVVKLVAVVIAGAVAKVGGCLVAAMIYSMQIQEGLELGLLMNAKGLVELIILNIGKDKHILSEQMFSLLVIMSVLLTSLVTPLLDAVAKSSRRFVAYKRRSVWWPNPESELRVLACVHHPSNVPSLITLLDISHPTKRSPIFVYALHLIELTGRAATLLVNSTASKDSSVSGGLSKVQTQSEQVVNAFETYEQHAGGVSVQTLSTFSPYQTMHEDICGIAEDKHVALILLPFHKHQTVDGFMEVTHPSIRSLNQSTITAAPCSFGILIDRGLGTTTGGLRGTTTGAPRGPTHSTTLNIGLIFIGGPDDRETLAFAYRMAGHPNISLTLLRFISGGLSDADTPSSPQQQSVISLAPAADDRESALDEACLEEFKARWEGGELEYKEWVSCNAEETVEGIREMVEETHDLYIVGRGYGTESPLTAGLTEWSECPELGPIGDLLSSSDFAARVSVLVVQQGRIAEGVMAAGLPDSPGRRHVKLYVNKPEVQW